MGFLFLLPALPKILEIAALVIAIVVGVLLSRALKIYINQNHR